jgi:hypothetical protein
MTENDPVHEAVIKARSALEQLAKAVGVSSNACSNEHGCPDHALAQHGRGGRCFSCWRYHRQHGRDRRQRYDRKD